MKSIYHHLQRMNAEMRKKLVNNHKSKTDRKKCILLHKRKRAELSWKEYNEKSTFGMNESILFISSSPVHFEAANKKIIQEEMPFHLSFGEYSASEKRKKNVQVAIKKSQKKYKREQKKIVRKWGRWNSFKSHLNRFA